MLTADNVCLEFLVHVCERRLLVTTVWLVASATLTLLKKLIVKTFSIPVDCQKQFEADLGAGHFLRPTELLTRPDPTRQQ
jgi:hypothetical protein